MNKGRNQKDQNQALELVEVEKYHQLVTCFRRLRKKMEPKEKEIKMKTSIKDKDTTTYKEMKDKENKASTSKSEQA